MTDEQIAEDLRKARLKAQVTDVNCDTFLIGRLFNKWQDDLPPGSALALFAMMGGGITSVTTNAAMRPFITKAMEMGPWVEPPPKAIAYDKHGGAIDWFVRSRAIADFKFDGHRDLMLQALRAARDSFDEAVSACVQKIEEREDAESLNALWLDSALSYAKETTHLLKSVAERLEGPA